MGFYS